MRRTKQYVFRVSAEAIAHADAYARRLARRLRRPRCRRAVAVRLLLLRGLSAADAAALAAPARSFRDDGPMAEGLFAWRQEVADLRHRGLPPGLSPTRALDPADLPDPGLHAPDADDLKRGLDRSPAHRLCIAMPPVLVAWIDGFCERVAQKHTGLVIDRASAVETLLRHGLLEEARNGPDATGVHAGRGAAPPHANPSD